MGQMRTPNETVCSSGKFKKEDQFERNVKLRLMIFHSLTQA